MSENSKKIEFNQIEVDKPFRINQKFPSGNLKDWTTFKVHQYTNTNKGILIYFHDLKRWINPPTDSKQEYNIRKQIDKYGIIYLKKGEEL